MTRVETLEQEGDALLRRLGYYVFMTTVGAALPDSSFGGSVLFIYGLGRSIVLTVRFTRTVLALRRAVRSSISHQPAPGLGRDASPGAASLTQPGGSSE